MTKNERRETLLGIGIIVLLLGVIAIYDGITRPLTFESFSVKTLEVIGGGFISVLGLYACCWGVSDEAGKDASKFLKSVWNRFLKALGK